MLPGIRQEVDKIISALSQVSDPVRRRERSRMTEHAAVAVVGLVFFGYFEMHETILHFSISIIIMD